MAVSRKNSRKIIVDGAEFRWRATGNDGWITVVVWPVSNDRSRLVGTIGYHHERIRTAGDRYIERGQIVVTNRLIRQLILHYGVEDLHSNNGQINAGELESIVDIADAIRAS